MELSDDPLSFLNEILEISTESLGSEMSKGKEQGEAPPTQNYGIVLNKISPDTYNLVIDPNVLYTMIDTTGVKALSLIFSYIPSGSTVRISMPGMGMMERGRFESTPAAFVCTMFTIGQMWLYRNSLKFVGVIDSQMSVLSGLFMLACDEWDVSFLGEVNLMLPPNWASSPMIAAAVPFLEGELMSHALSKNYLTQDDVLAFRQGSAIRLRPEAAA